MLLHTHLWSIIFLSCLFTGFVWCAHFRMGMIPLLLLGIVWNVYVPYKLSWNGAKVLVICIVVLWFLRREEFPRVSDSINPNILILLSLYVIAMTVIGALALEDTTLNSMQGSIFQKAPLRGIIATGFWFFGPACFLIGHRYASSSHVVDTCAKVFLFSSAVAAIVAILQLTTYYTFPSVERLLAFFCVGAYKAPGTTITESSTWGWYRPSPFCAEARHFGVAMALAAATVILSRRFTLKSVPRFLNHYVWIIIYVGLCFASASTSAIAGMIFALGGLLLWFFLIKSRHVFTGKESVKILAILAISFGILFMVEKRSGAITKRFELYFDSYGLLNPSSEWFRGAHHKMGASAYLAWLLDSPPALAFGVGPGNAAYRAFQYCSLDAGGESAKGLILSSRFPLIDLLGSIGLLGILLLVSFWGYCWKICSDHSMVIPDTAATRLLFLRGMLVFLMLYLVSYDSTLLIWLVFGIMLRLNGHQQYAANRILFC